MNHKLNIAVFGSGRGSNFNAILTAIRNGRIPGARICLVISNNSTAGIMDIARANSLPAIHLSQRQFADEAAFVDEMLKVLRRHGTNLIALAGYMKRLPSRVVHEYHHSILNIHPALLPKFGGVGMYGMHVHEAVIAAREKVSGATVHIVDEEYDHGPIVLQKTVPVAADDTPDSLAAKVIQVEHELYPEAIALFAEGRVPVAGEELATQKT